MAQNWQKQGLIYSGRAQIPTVHVVDDKIWRIYFADRTPDNKSYIRYIDVEASNLKNILYEHKESILPLGLPGTFDFAGQMPSWILPYKDELRMYYIGWTQRQDVPYQNAIGLAISQDNGKTFQKYSSGPILSTDSNDPYFVTTPYVEYSINGYFHLFYASCDGWDQSEPYYNIKHRVSKDGINNWDSPQICIDYNLNEKGICRSSLIGSKMWYCYRKGTDYRTNKNNSYRIGYADLKLNLSREAFYLLSLSGAAPIRKLIWTRKDSEINLPLSEKDWDSTMICYPYVLQHQNTLYLLYNGDGFGQTGIGYATLTQ